MLAEKNIKINKDLDLDAVYVNYLDAPYYDSDSIDTEEIEDGIYRVYNEEKPYITYRYTILDFSYNNKRHLENITGIDFSNI
ncbi:hypothetical protein [Mammaliicoccus sciuri]|uniref:hypothetical protein n=1 Tax=Mammaliicoccus sciuri TaxID=1296 RepID=UPI002DB9027A|nr:hypothetical protein [Mammaliicoccus sciuri]MEB6122794.1 hypothetical protein [Mammaliicoccus sciuri]MEB6313023.1 hypothetical protein [Mammaliicoccus sciuri]MEB6696529.1 hypothetical protein [Mammaliicoccus sciuri]